MPSQSWGPSVSTNSGSRFTIAYDSVTISGSTGRVTNPRLEFYSKSGWSDSTNSLTGRGSAVATKGWTNQLLNGGTKTFPLVATDVTLKYGDTTSAYIEGVVANVSFFNGDAQTSTYRFTFDMPALPWSAPNAPTGVTLRRVDDNLSRVTFGGNQTTRTQDKYTQTVDWDYKLDEDGNPWTSGARNVAGTSTQVDVGVPTSNRRIKVRVRFANSTGGASGWSESAWLVGRPAAPTVGVPDKSGATVTARWSNNAAYATGTHVFWSENNGAEFDPGMSYAGTVTSGTRTVDTSKTHRYRVRASVSNVPMVDGSTQTLLSDASAWSQTIQLQAPPSKPLVARSAPVLDARSTSLTITIQPRPVDGSALAAAELRYRIGTAAWTTLNKGSTLR